MYLQSLHGTLPCFLVFGSSTFGVMLSLLYLCSLNPNTVKSILKFDTVYSKNKLFKYKKGKKTFKLASRYELLHTPLLIPNSSHPQPPLFCLVLDSWLMAQVTETSNDPNFVVQINCVCAELKKYKGQVIFILYQWFH